MRARPRRSTSMASCATTICRQSPEQGDLAVNLTPKAERDAREPRHRARYPQAARGPATARRARRSRSSRCRPGRRCSRRCSRKSMGRTPQARRALADKVRKAFDAVDFVVDIDDSFGTRGERLRYSHRPGSAGVSRRAGAGGLRHDRRADRRREDRLLAARRRPEADRHHRRAAAVGHDRRRAHPFDAAAGGRHGAPGRECRARRRRARYARAQLLSDLPAQRPLRGDGERRGRGPLRGADLRHARGRGRDEADRLGQGRRAADQISRPAASTMRSRPCCGTASGKSPTSRSATWAPPSWWRSSASICLS